jgi:hypothetical protein
MKHLIRFIVITFLLAYFQPLNAQLKWEVAEESITLTPDIFIEKGVLYVSILRNRDRVERACRGEITIDLSEKVIYFNDNENIFRFKKDDISRLSIDGVGTVEGQEVFNKDFADSLKINYRSSLYTRLNLNEIEFSSSKRIAYDIGNDGLFLKNQKKSLGKICYVSQKSIVILYENGDLEEFKEGDYNYLQVGTFKAFKCIHLYDYIYGEFKNQLKDNIARWESNALNLDLESLISRFGSFDNISTVSPDLKMIVWKKTVPVYSINMGTTTNTFSHSQASLNGQINTYQKTDLYGFSPLLVFGNSYRNTVSNMSSSGTTQVMAQTRQSGLVSVKDEGYSVSVLLNANNKGLKIFHQNIFTDPNYGEPFRFISF